MNIVQKMNRTIYPLLKAAGSILGFKGKKLLNKSNASPAKPIYSLEANTNMGKAVNFDTFRGKHLLIANTASQCGYTAQYAELQQLQDKYAGTLTVLAFPANNFGEQEQGANSEIAEFCAVNFGVKFPVMLKSDVVGAEKNPVFSWLTDPAQNGWNSKEPSWNFCKYLVGPDGKLLGFFESAVSPMDEEIQRLVKG